MIQVPATQPKFSNSPTPPGQPGGKRIIAPPQVPPRTWTPNDPQTQALLRGVRLS